MRKKIFVICFAMALLVAAGCSKSKESQKQTETVPEQDAQKYKVTSDFIGDEVRNYIVEADADTTVTSMIELNGADSTFTFTYDILLSPRFNGTFDVEDGILTAKAMDGKGQYLFKIEDNDTLKFVKDGSSDIVLSGEADYKKLLQDQAVFKMEENIMPTKEKVYEMREKVLEGMTDEEKKDLTDKVKAANEWLERAWVSGGLFDTLTAPDALEWKYLEEDMIQLIREQESEDMIQLIQEQESHFKNNLLKADLENLIQNIRQAKENHDVENLKQIYFILHDMDYFLLRYGIEDIGRKVTDMSAVSTYYGALEIYKN